MPDRDDERLEELQDEIDQVRRQAQEHGTLPDDDEQRLIDPDGDGDVDPHKVQPSG